MINLINGISQRESKVGYYTRHELSTSEGINEEHTHNIGELTEYGSDMFNGDTIKWYECEKDMKEYSKKYPDIVFTVYGEGEESGDIWNSHFKNGKMHTCKAKMVMKPYDEALLI